MASAPSEPTALGRMAGRGRRKRPASAKYAKANKWRPAPFEIIDIAERIARPVKMLAKR